MMKPATRGSEPLAPKEVLMALLRRAAPGGLLLTSFLASFVGSSVVSSPAAAAEPVRSTTCRIASALVFMSDAPTEDLEQLRTLVCSLGEAAPTGSLFYPNGAYAFVGSGFADSGSWRYPSGKYAFVSGDYADKGSWHYPDGAFAFVSGDYADAGSWRYANGKYAYVAGNYADAGSYYYATGAFAFVHGDYADAGSWKYPDGRYAYVSGNYSDAGWWYYPNKNVFSKTGPRSDDGAELVSVVELYKGTTFPQPDDFAAGPATLQVLERLAWVKAQLAQ
jgi:hypothetical protein